MIEDRLSTEELEDRLTKISDYSKAIPFILPPKGVAMRPLPTLDGVVAIEFINIFNKRLVMTLRERPCKSVPHCEGCIESDNPPIWLFSNGEMCLMDDEIAIQWMLNHVLSI